MQPWRWWLVGPREERRLFEHCVVEGPGTSQSLDDEMNESRVDGPRAFPHDLDGLTLTVTTLTVWPWRSDLDRPLKDRTLTPFRPETATCPMSIVSHLLTFIQQVGQQVGQSRHVPASSRTRAPSCPPPRRSRLQCQCYQDRHALRPKFTNYDSLLDCAQTLSTAHGAKNSSKITSLGSPVRYGIWDVT